MLYLTLRQYEYIIGIAEAGSLTKAAATLNVSQPSLSVAITRVEARLGAAIFARGKGASITITPFGHGLIANARKVLDMATAIERKQDAQPIFTLGCFEDLAPWFLAPAMATLSKRFPETSFKSAEGRFASISSDLAEGRMDLAICYDVGFDAAFQRRVIKSAQPVAFLSPDNPLSDRASLELDEVARHPVILFSEGRSDAHMRDLFAQEHLAPTVCQQVTSLELMRSLAAYGGGIGISYARPPSDITYDGKPLVTIPIVTPAARSDIVLVWSALRERDAQFDAIVDMLS
ncbi:LysR family transcriptional regulator [Gymnodinialimonas sp. 57CJ19]|uniref:LysR family transcriptional regulator n=1 Tax=Gymnodinialimonas sp. 57CJ19 TaxID=3138498 RepID=UPI0031343EB4